MKLKNSNAQYKTSITEISDELTLACQKIQNRSKMQTSPDTLQGTDHSYYHYDETKKDQFKEDQDDECVVTQVINVSSNGLESEQQNVKIENQNQNQKENQEYVIDQNQNQKSLQTTLNSNSKRKQKHLQKKRLQQFQLESASANKLMTEQNENQQNEAKTYIFKPKQNNQHCTDYDSPKRKLHTRRRKHANKKLQQPSQSQYKEQQQQFQPIKSVYKQPNFSNNNKIKSEKQSSPKSTKSNKHLQIQNVFFPSERTQQQKQQHVVVAADKVKVLYRASSENQQQEDEDDDEEQSEEDEDDENKNTNSSTREIPQNPYVDKVIFKSENFYTLINAQIPFGNFIKLIIKRVKTGDSFFFDNIVMYECYLLQEKKHLLTCMKNRFMKTTSKFEFFRNKNPHRDRSQDIYGVLKSNFSGTQYVFKSSFVQQSNSEKQTAMYKTGEMAQQEKRKNQAIQNITRQFSYGDKNMKKSGKSKMFYEEKSTLESATGGKRKSIEQVLSESQSLSLNQDKLKQTCYICFGANFLGFAGQRQVSLYKKTNKKLNKSFDNKFSIIKQAIQDGQQKKYRQFQNRKAKKGDNGLELWFNDGVKRMQSSKNMILEDDMNKQILQFGKVKTDIYSVSVGYPLNLMEGIAFAIANLDRKFLVS